MKIEEAFTLKEGDEFLVITTSKEIAEKYRSEVHSTFTTKENQKAWYLRAKFQAISINRNINCLIDGEKKCIYYGECQLKSGK
jgi:hypothetical protein